MVLGEGVAKRQPRPPSRIGNGCGVEVVGRAGEVIGEAAKDQAVIVRREVVLVVSP